MNVIIASLSYISLLRDCETFFCATALERLDIFLYTKLGTPFGPGADLALAEMFREGMAFSFVSSPGVVVPD